MLALMLIVLAQSPGPSNSRVLRVERVPGNRMVGGRLGASPFAFFEAFPVGGAGVVAACSTTAPTGARGDVATFGRASSGMCTKTATGGAATTGIANGDLVLLSSNVARIVYDGSGNLGVLAEPIGVNLNANSEDLTNASYTNVGAPTVTANTSTAPDNAATMDTIQDNSAAALEGRAQAITVSAGQPYTLSIYVRAGTLNSVTVSLDGTTATCTSMSAVTNTRCIVTDVSASGVSISAQILGGTVVGDTGTFLAWGMQVEAGVYASSYIPTPGLGTRNMDLLSFPYAQTSPTTGSFAASVYLFGATLNNAGLLSQEVGTTFKQSLISIPASQTNVYNGGVSKASATTNAAGQHRIVGWFDGSSTNVIWDGTPSAGTAGTPATVDTIRIGNYQNSFVQPGIYSRICADPSPTRCR